MTSRLQKAIAITCLVSLIVASIALAENEPPRRGGRSTAQPGRSGGMMQPGGGRGMGGPGEMGMGRGRGMSQELIPQSIRQKLNLTEEQNNKLKAAQDEQMKKTQALAKKNLELKQKLDEAVDKGDKDAVIATAQEMGKAIGESALLKMSEKDILKGILNEEQMKTIEDYNKKRAEMREKMRKQMEERMKGRGQRPERGQGQGPVQGRGRGQQPQESPRRSR